MFFEMLPKFNIMSEISNTSNKAHDIDANIDDPIQCKYYSVEDLKMIPKKKALNIFHSNVNGLDTHFENLYEFLANDNSPVFDIINITETSQQTDLNFKTNVNMKGYNMFTNGSNSQKGGVAIYVNNQYDKFEREDLKKRDNDYETLWIEIKK